MFQLAQQGSYVAYHDMTLAQLEALVKSNALQQYHLEYLDTYRSDNQLSKGPSIIVNVKHSVQNILF